MSNKSQAIIIRDMPHCVRDGLSELEGVEDTDVAVTIQSVISEVGEAKMMRFLLIQSHSRHILYVKRERTNYLDMSLVKCT